MKKIIMVFLGIMILLLAVQPAVYAYIAPSASDSWESRSTNSRSNPRTYDSWQTKDSSSHLDYTGTEVPEGNTFKSSNGATYSRAGYGRSYGTDVSGLKGLYYSDDAYGNSWGNDHSGLSGRYSDSGYGNSWGDDHSGLTGPYSDNGYGKSWGNDHSDLNGEYVYCEDVSEGCTVGDHATKATYEERFYPYYRSPETRAPHYYKVRYYAW